MNTFKFEFELNRLCVVVGPFAKAIKCLESTHSTASDVYVFWLAVAAQLEEAFTTGNKAELENESIESIRRLFNTRFNQMINNAPTDIYVTAFFLDPRMLPSTFSFILLLMACRISGPSKLR